MCDKVAIMYCGMVMEYLICRTFTRTRRTRPAWGLFDSLPDLDTEVPRLKLDLTGGAGPTELPAGCPFENRAPRATGALQNRNVRSSRTAQRHAYRARSGGWRTMSALLEVKNLTSDFKTARGTLTWWTTCPSPSTRAAHSALSANPAPASPRWDALSFQLHDPTAGQILLTVGT